MQELIKKVAALVERLPDADKPRAESKFTGPDPAAAEAIVKELLAMGRPGVAALIDMVKETTDPEYVNYKREYLLHTLCLYVGRPGMSEQRRWVVGELSERVRRQSLSKGLRGFFIRELQVVGGPEVVESLAEQLLDDFLGQYAAQALVAIGNGAAAKLRQALPKAKGRNRVHIAQALGALRDAEAVEPLKETLKSRDRDLRVVAAWALANIGAEEAAETLLQQVAGSKGWERSQAVKACLVLAEKLAAAGKKDSARKLYVSLRQKASAPEELYVRQAVSKALRAL